MACVLKGCTSYQHNIDAYVYPATYTGGGSWTNTRSPLNPAMRSNRKTRSKCVPLLLKKDQDSVPLMEHRAHLSAEFKNDSVPFLDYKSPCHIGHN